MRKGVDILFWVFRRAFIFSRILCLRFRGVDIAWTATLERGCLFYLRGGRIKIESGVIIGVGVVLDAQGGSITIGNSSTVNAYCFVGGKGGVQIGEKVMVAPHASIHSSSHNIFDTSMPMREQGDSLGRVIIGNDVWVGTHVAILQGVALGNGSIVGAGSVVSRDVGPYEIHAGMPNYFVSKRL